MKFATFFAAAVLSFGAAQAMAEDGNEILDNSPSGGAMAVDLLIIRPVSLVGTVLGLGLFILELPLAVLQGEVPTEPARKLVAEPFKYTFTRRLGSMEYAH